MPNELTIGSIGLSVIITMFLKILYCTWDLDNRYKAIFAVIIGVVLSLVVFFSTDSVPTIGSLTTYIVQGFMTGATATGLYEMTKARGPGDF